MRSTIEAIASDLTEDGFVPPKESTPTGWGGRAERSSSAPSGWCHAWPRRARWTGHKLFDRLGSCANDLGLLAVGEDEWRPTLGATPTPDRFLVSPGVRESGEECVFHRRPDGRVASMMLATTSLRRLDPVDEGW